MMARRSSLHIRVRPYRPRGHLRTAPRTPGGHPLRQREAASLLPGHSDGRARALAKPHEPGRHHRGAPQDVRRGDAGVLPLHIDDRDVGDRGEAGTADRAVTARAPSVRGKAAATRALRTSAPTGAPSSFGALRDEPFTSGGRRGTIALGSRGPAGFPPLPLACRAALPPTTDSRCALGAGGHQTPTEGGSPGAHPLTLVLPGTRAPSIPRRSDASDEEGAEAQIGEQSPHLRLVGPLSEPLGRVEDPWQQL